MKNIFLRIIDGELPCDKVYENDRILAIKDIAPAAPVHILIIPKKVIPNIFSVTEEDGPLLAEMVIVANQLAVQFHIQDGFRLLTNNGNNAGQAIDQLHFHLIGGKRLGPVA